MSLALSGLPRAPAEEAPVTIDRARAAGFRGVQLDATAPGFRARDLDRSARRGLAALLRRAELALSGLDLLIPPRHFADPSHADRALAAALAAIDLAADLSSLAGSGPGVLCVALSEGAEPPGPGVAGPLVERAETCGVALADLGSAWSAPPERYPRSPLGAAIDPGAALARGADPGSEASRAGGAIVQARLSDWSGLGRCAPGEGRLDELAYLVALSTAGYRRALVLDLRGVAEGWRAAERLAALWAAA